MASRAILILLGILTVAPAFALDHVATGRTFDPNISVEKRYPHNLGGHELWLKHSETGKEERVYTTVRHAELRFSTDMEWLLVDDAAGSGATHCYLYLRKGEKGSLTYRRAKNLSDLAWKFFEKETGYPIVGIGRRHVNSIAILTNPRVIILTLRGRGGPADPQVDDWVCLYAVESETFTTDLEPINRASAGLPKSGNQR